MLLLAALGAERSSYVVTPGCPAETAFWGEVWARSLVVGSSSTAIDVHVTITASTSAFVGAVSVAHGAPRSLRSSSCEDLVRGLALVTAMLVDAEPVRVEPGRVPRPAEPDRTRPSTATTTGRIRVDAAPARAQHGVRSSERRSRELPARPPGEEGPGLAVGVGAGVALGQVPGVAPAVPVFAELRWPGGPSARVTLRRVSGEASPLPSGGVAYAWTVGRVDVCPTELEVGLVTATACAQAEGGLLAADPQGLPEATPSRDAWLAFGAALRVRAEVLVPVFVEAGLSVSAPVLRSRYLLVPAYEVYTTPSVVADLELAAGVRFW